MLLFISTFTLVSTIYVNITGDYTLDFFVRSLVWTVAIVNFIIGLKAYWKK